MAASKGYFSKSNYRFLSNGNRNVSVTSSDMELNESDIWNSRSQSPSPARGSARASSPVAATARCSYRKQPVIKPRVPSSVPVNVPDWSKILKDEYIENQFRIDHDDDDENDVEDRIPPHEFLAKQFARNRIASFSVHEGVGRTLKGRDLSRVRNAIFEKTGFQD
ncbi:hypothetical protein CQW23_26954 [Capsicum baccatum]|uniref:Senescence regulator n=1 Tax=Capsicum baccatum TaxID=33114 RepID=A0A2G2VQA0_CAPBA|nr:hypothetical protein CQW23_26954 [Capsicum baccatum]